MKSIYCENCGDELILGFNDDFDIKLCSVCQSEVN